MTLVNLAIRVAISAGLAAGLTAVAATSYQGGLASRRFSADYTVKEVGRLN